MLENKQIIINGVDVSGCKHYEDHTLYDCNETCKINGGIVCTKCKDNPNCYYKQLKRKEQECKELKKQNDCNCLDSCCKKQQLDQLKAENEKQKEFRKLLEEQMEFNRNELELALSSEIKRSDFLLKEFQKVDKQRDNWREQAEKYSQTLTEIKKIAESMNKECFYDDFDCKDCDMKKGCTHFNKKEILQKISEVEYGTC